MDPITMLLLSSLVTVGGNSIGGMANAGELRQAKKEDMATQNRLLDNQETQQRFQNRLDTTTSNINKATLALGQNRFAEEKFASNYGITSKEMDRIQQILSSNVALKNNVLKTWAMA